MAVNRIATASVLLARGLALFDLVRGERRPTARWQRRCTTNRREVEAWVRAGDNLGVGCRASNVAVLDLDRHPGEPNGLEQFAALCEQHGQPWPATFTSATPHDGRHLFFRVPADRVVPSTSGPNSPLGPGIDIRGPGRELGGYVVAPSSVVPAGEYRVLYDVPIAELPSFLVPLISEPLNRPPRIPGAARQCNGFTSDGQYCNHPSCKRRTRPGR